MKKFLAFILAFCMLFVLCACGADKTDTDTKNPENKAEVTSEIKETSPKFKVTVTDEEGNAVAGVMLQVCKDSCVPARTDAEGVATFPIVNTGGYKLSILSCPEGYEYTGESEIYLEPDSNEYSIQISKK